MTLLQITAPHFCAGIELSVPTRHKEPAVVEKAAPIVRYMLYWTESRVKSYCRTKGWSWKEVKNESQYKKDT